WEWDVKRLAASIAVAGRERGLSERQRRSAVLAAVSQYRTAMRSFAEMSNLAVWHAHLDMELLFETARSELDRDPVKRTEATLAKARTRDSLRAFSKLAEIVNGEPRIISDPPLIVPFEEFVEDEERGALLELLRESFRAYKETVAPDRRRLLEQYRLVHFARKVVGVGSVGTRASIALLVGRDLSDPLFLQIKEANESVLERFVGSSEYENHAERVVAGQRLMQAAGDMFLGWRQVE